MVHDQLAINRRRFLAYCSSVGLGGTLLPGTLTAVAGQADEITVEMVEAAERLAGLAFDPAYRERFVEELTRNRAQYETLREQIGLDQSIPPCLVFNPIPPGYEVVAARRPATRATPVDIPRPASERELAHLPVTHLGHLIRTRQVTSRELTELFLRRLRRYDALLNCVVSYTDDLAFAQARRADDELAAGTYRGPLHGIPWGAKDLIAVSGTPTTWGSAPFRDQVIDTDATVYRRLTEAGAVLVAKLATTALAGGDSRWFGGETKNPWDPEISTGGSSGGPAAATAAGLVGFAIGTETYGSIINPSSNCGLSGLRPTFGRVSRWGVMPLSWTLDKVGPMCRSVEDCAVVLGAIVGPDGLDMAVVDRPFEWDPDVDVARIRVGYLRSAFDAPPEAESEEDRRRAAARQRYDREALEVLRSLGIDLIPVELPPSIHNDHIDFIRHTEGAAMFDEIVRDGRIDEIPNNRRFLFRVRRFVPGVEYLQANRARTVLMQEMNRAIADVDLYVAPGDNVTGLTNHTGHPALTIPHGFVDGRPVGLKFIGALFKEAEMLAVARAFEQATGYHRMHPEI